MKYLTLFLLKTREDVAIGALRVKTKIPPFRHLQQLLSAPSSIYEQIAYNTNNTDQIRLLLRVLREVCQECILTLKAPRKYASENVIC